MIYFTSAINRDEIIQLIGVFDLEMFCFWQAKKGSVLYGAVKDSAYELFIGACSMDMVRHMKFASPDQVLQAMKADERVIICGNQNLIEA